MPKRRITMAEFMRRHEGNGTKLRSMASTVRFRQLAYKSRSSADKWKSLRPSYTDWLAIKILKSGGKAKKKRPRCAKQFLDYGAIGFSGPLLTGKDWTAFRWKAQCEIAVNNINNSPGSHARLLLEAFRRVWFTKKSRNPSRELIFFGFTPLLTASILQHLKIVLPLHQLP